MSEEWDGTERRKGRQMYSRGPIVRALEISSALAGLAAVGALVLALVLFGGRLDTIQSARQRAAYDSCKILSTLISKSASTTEKLPVYDLKGVVSGYVKTGSGSQGRQVQAFISSVGLANCNTYAVRVREGHLAKTEASAAGYSTAPVLPNPDDR